MPMSLRRGLVALNDPKAVLRAVCVQDLTKEDFPLPSLGPRLVELLDEVRVGRGFQYIR